MKRKKKLKLRKKRYLKKITKRSVKQIGKNVSDKPLLNPDDIERALLQRTIPATLPRADLYLGKYEAENAEYQARLDTVYAGTVSPIERFIHHNAILLHNCSECGKQFFAKPLWLLTKDNQKHVCGVNTVTTDPKKVRRKLTESDIRNGNGFIS